MSRSPSSAEWGEVNPAYRAQLSYIDRSREYYKAKGFSNPYRWAKHKTAPFSPLTKPLSESVVGVVTTSFPSQPPSKKGKTVMATPSEPPPAAMFTNDLFWHKKATTTDDVESFLPLATLQTSVQTGRLGSLSDRFYSVPTSHSRRQAESDAIIIETLCREDNVDVVVLVPL